MSITKPYQICTRCVMDSSDPLITFNSKGECNHCTEYIAKRIHHKYQGEKSDQQFLAFIEEMKAAGKGKKYDCVMGLSGGIDSSYAALIGSQHGLRILGVHLDNGWNSEAANTNMENIVQKLGIDYERVVLDWEEFKDLQLSFLKAAVPEAETPTDNGIIAVLHQVASKYNIKHIISGGNFSTEGILPASWHYNAKDMRYLKAIHRKFGTKKLGKNPYFGFQAEMYYKLVKKIKIVYLLNYVDYCKEDAMEKLKDKLDWQYYGGKHYESLYTGFIQSYYLPSKFNIDYRRATYSSQICTKVITRKEALKELETPPYNLEKVEVEKSLIAEKWEIPQEELEEILKRKGNWYTHYPNSERFLKFVYDSYRKIFRKEKLASF